MSPNIVYAEIAVTQLTTFCLQVAAASQDPLRLALSTLYLIPDQPRDAGRAQKHRVASALGSMQCLALKKVDQHPTGSSRPFT